MKTWAPNLVTSYLFNIWHPNQASLQGSPFAQWHTHLTAALCDQCAAWNIKNMSLDHAALTVESWSNFNFFLRRMQIWKGYRTFLISNIISQINNTKLRGKYKNSDIWKLIYTPLTFIYYKEMNIVSEARIHYYMEWPAFHLLKEK